LRKLVQRHFASSFRGGSHGADILITMSWARCARRDGTRDALNSVNPELKTPPSIRIALDFPSRFKHAAMRK
jgi:hypothetical protein